MKSVLKTACGVVLGAALVGVGRAIVRGAVLNLVAADERDTIRTGLDAYLAGCERAK